MDQEEEGGGVLLAAFPNRLFRKTAEVSVLIRKEVGKSEGTWDIPILSWQKQCLSFSRKELLIQISFSVVKNQYLLASSKYKICI